MITGLDHVQLAMPGGEEERARAFYRGVLGLAEIDKPEALKARGGVWFQAGAQGLHLGVEAPFSPAKKAHPALRVEGLEELARELEASGIALTWDGAIPTVRRFFAHDPFGNRLEFLETR